MRAALVRRSGRAPGMSGGEKGCVCGVVVRPARQPLLCASAPQVGGPQPRSTQHRLCPTTTLRAPLCPSGHAWAFPRGRLAVLGRDPGGGAGEPRVSGCVPVTALCLGLRGFLGGHCPCRELGPVCGVRGAEQVGLRQPVRPLTPAALTAQPSGTVCGPLWAITGKQCWRRGVIRERRLQGPSAGSA